MDAFAYLSRCCCVFAEEEDELNMISRGQGGMSRMGMNGNGQLHSRAKRRLHTYLPDYIVTDWTGRHG